MKYKKIHNKIIQRQLQMRLIKKSLKKNSFSPEKKKRQKNIDHLS